jgi:hypothetical protein
MGNKKCQGCSFLGGCLEKTPQTGRPTISSHTTSWNDIPEEFQGCTILDVRNKPQTLEEMDPSPWMEWRNKTNHRGFPRGTQQKEDS